MQTHKLTQGTPEWMAYRSQHFNASDAPAMMGCSPYKTRRALLKEFATGLGEEVNAATQKIFDAGHRFEALARPLAESIIGEELYPVVGSQSFEGIGRGLSASFDGLTLLEEVGFEHKSLNDALRACMIEGATGADLPMHYRVQMEQQCMVSGCPRILFVASKWAGDELVEERHVWYDRDPELAEQILAGWAQFERDVAIYQPEEAPAPAAVATVTHLPAVSVRMSGELSVSSNLPDFGQALRAFVERIPKAPSTDQEFADAEAACKTLKSAEEALEAAESGALAQTDVDAIRRTVAELKSVARAARLAAERAVTNRKEQIKAEAILEGKRALAQHIEELVAKIGKPYLPNIPADFAAAIKGKRTVEGLRTGIDQELARAKAEASRIADRILANLSTLRSLAADFVFLFADTPALVLKAPEDCEALIRARIAEHTANEAARKAREDADAAEAAAIASAQEQRAAELAAEALTRAAAPSAPALASQPEQAAGAADDLTLKLGHIAGRLGFTLSAEFLATLGFAAVKQGGASLYRESQWPAICAALSAHVLKAAKAAHA